MGTDHLKHRFSTLILKAHWSACFKRIPFLAHLTQIIKAQQKPSAGITCGVASSIKHAEQRALRSTAEKH